MVSPRPSWVSPRPSMIVWPPSSRMPTSNDTRVRVEGFSKIMASVLPPNGLSWAPPFGPPFSRAFFIALPRSRIWRRVFGSTWSRSRKCFGLAIASGGLGARFEGLRGLRQDVDALVEGRLVGDQRREDAHDVLA